ncbi:MAG: glycosyltransferase family 2 protein [Pseudomonadota bacterium]
MPRNFSNLLKRKIAMVDLSVVTTLYNSAEFIEEFYERVCKSASEISGDFEIILVNDGSPDNSYELAISLAKKDSRIVLVDLSRNFGHHTAILAGLNHTRGKLIFFVDSDLEDPPELLPQFYEKMQEDASIDVVHGRHSQSQGNALRRYTSRGFWRFFNYLADVKVENNSCSVRLFTRNYLNALLAMPERNIFLGGMFHWPGFKQVSVHVDRKLRRKVSTYTFFSRIKLFLLALSDFSTKPLLLIFFLGISIAGIAGILGLYFLAAKIINPSGIALGFTALIISVWFVGGLTMATLGIMGIYVARIYTEVKGRPQFVVRSVQNFTADRADIRSNPVREIDTSERENSN